MTTTRMHTSGSRDYRSVMYVFQDGTSVSASFDKSGKYATASVRLAGHLQAITIGRHTAARILLANRRAVTDKAIFS